MEASGLILKEVGVRKVQFMVLKFVKGALNWDIADKNDIKSRNVVNLNTTLFLEGSIKKHKVTRENVCSQLSQREKEVVFPGRARENKVWEKIT